MVTIAVEYSREKCIGAKCCVAASPEFFGFDGEKAVLKNSRKVDGNNGIYHLQAALSRQQAESVVEAGKNCPVNAIKVINADTKEVLVTTDVSSDDVEVIHAQYDDKKEFVMDPKGYFLIRINPAEKTIEVGLCREINKVAVKVIGKKPLEIYQTIIKKGLLSRFDHAAYVGRELQKAYIALQQGIPYVQDDELSF